MSYFMMTSGAGGGGYAGGFGAGGGMAGNQRRQGASHGHSASMSQKAKLSNAYQELGKELTSSQIKMVGNYTLGRTIGEGTYGKVRLGIHRLTNTRVAVKQIPKSLPSGSLSYAAAAGGGHTHGFGLGMGHASTSAAGAAAAAASNSTPLQLLTREIHHHRRFHHPNVVQLYEVIATESHIWMVSELCPGGELFDFLVERGRLTPYEARRVFGQLCLAVGYLHSEGVVHRDLKLENVLLDERCNVKVADFGFGREFEGRQMLKTFCGTTGYAAPELLAAKSYSAVEVDIWSLGVILYALLTGSLPFDDDDDWVMKDKILKGNYEIPHWLGDEASDLVYNILQQDPTRRLSIKQILSHEWFHMSLPNSHQFPPFEQPNPLDSLPPAIPEAEETSTLGGSVSSLPPQPQQQQEAANSSLKDGRPTSSSSRPSSSRNASPGLPRPPSTPSSNADDSASDREAAFSISSSEGGRSGATTPITSDDDGATAAILPSPIIPDVNKEPPTPIGTGPSKLGYHRNESQTTIRRDGSGELNDGTPRPASNTRSRTPLPTHHELPSPRLAAEADLTVDALEPPPRPSLERHFSSTGGSAFSTKSHQQPPIHSRTPSRTKRRSIGSAVSERLVALEDEEFLPTPDYFTMLTRPREPPLSSDLERNLLNSLSLLGIDIGQIEHSVQTHACDAAGALWWMLKRKAEQREAEKEGMPPTTPLLKNPRRHEVDSDSDDSDDDEEVLANPFAPPSSSLLQPQNDSQIATSVSAPMLNSYSEPGFASFSSVSLGPSSSTDPHRDFRSTTGSPEGSIVKSSIESSTESPSSPQPDAPRKRPTTKPRSASITMLQRATSAIGSGLSLKKSDDLEKTKTEEEGRSTPNLSSFFGRKGSGAGAKDAIKEVSKEEENETTSVKDHERAPRSPVNSPTRRNHESRSEQALPNSDTNPSSTSLATTKTAAPTSTVSDSTSALNLKAAPASPQLTTTTSRQKSTPKQPVKPRSRTGIFSSFRLWFQDDRRKRGSRQPPSPMAYDSNRPSRRNSVIREGVRSQRSSTMYLGREGLTPSGRLSRRSSTNSIVMRSPMGGSELETLMTPLNRRTSECSRTSIGSLVDSHTPTSERGGSRPPSAQSYARRRHNRGSSAGSAGSMRMRGNGSPGPSWRRPPTSTTVRRISASTVTPRHNRNQSNSSSVGTASSSRSSLAERRDSYQSNRDDLDEPIMEENEEGESAEGGSQRDKALQKLSGESPRRPRPPKDRPSADSTGSGRSTVTVFTAHKNRSIFGPPTASMRSNASTVRPPLRDIFARPSSTDDEWVDEDEDELDGFAGGFGQPTSKGSSSSSPSAESEMPPEMTSGPVFGEGRYAGIGGRGEASAGGWRPGTMKNSVAHGPTITEEEEEEEEE